VCLGVFAGWKKLFGSTVSNETAFQHRFLGLLFWCFSGLKSCYFDWAVAPFGSGSGFGNIVCLNSSGFPFALGCFFSDGLGWNGLFSHTALYYKNLALLKAGFVSLSVAWGRSLRFFLFYFRPQGFLFIPQAFLIYCFLGLPSRPPGGERSDYYRGGPSAKTSRFARDRR